MIILLLYFSRYYYYYYYACPEWRRWQATVARNGKIINTSLAGLYKSHHITPVYLYSSFTCNKPLCRRSSRCKYVYYMNIYIYMRECDVCAHVLEGWFVQTSRHVRSEWRPNRRRPEVCTPVVNDNYYNATRAMVPTTRLIYKCTKNKPCKKNNVFIYYTCNIFCEKYRGSTNKRQNYIESKKLNN